MFGPNRFWSKVIDDPSGCWLWTAAKDRGGYGYYWLNDRMRMAHRVSYQEMVGDIPTGLTLDHLCRNRPCVNPYHLDPVPLSVNIARKPPVTHCPKGHEYTPENTKPRPGGYKQCRACHRLYEERRRWTLKIQNPT